MLTGWQAGAVLSGQVKSGRAAESQTRRVTWECRFCQLLLEEPEGQRPSVCPALSQRAARMALWSCNPAFSRVTDETEPQGQATCPRSHSKYTSALSLWPKSPFLFLLTKLFSP